MLNTVVLRSGKFSNFGPRRFDGRRRFASAPNQTQKVDEKPKDYKPPFDKILIANRGEIACRVISTARKMGIKTVAIHSEVDYRSKHVMMADEAVNLGGTSSATSYLLMENVIKACKMTGAQAVHPGYGFLSENAGFAKRLEEEGIAFIGPSAYSISAMGDKIESKKLAKKAGVNIIPGKLADVDTIEEVVQIAKEIGYPVMIKASAGGGGKGMRVAWNDQEAAEGFKLAKTEAKASFGDDRLLIEKFIDEPRHIEIQILADGQGTTLYLNERECSIQRRNQKVLEEAPSSFIDPKTREAMGKQAVALAENVQYKSAGTVEFLVDSKKNFYFLEMNTRLQVEHPVTEYITGLDLVEHMINVAAGKKLTLKQSDIPIKGWAMEARVYAEDPLRNFLPSIGTLTSYKEPTSERGENSVRVDSGIREGDEISIYYDPLISKLTTYGKTRHEAIDNLKLALDTYQIKGVNHNVCFLRDVLENERYQSGNITTKFIPEEYPKGFKGHVLTDKERQELNVAAATIHFQNLKQAGRTMGQLPYSAAKELSGTYHVTVDGQETKVEVSEDRQGEGYSAKLNGEEKTIKSEWLPGTPIFRGNFNDDQVVLQVENNQSGNYTLQFFGTKYPVTVRSAMEASYQKIMPVKKAIDTSKFLASPMPGKVLNILVKPGDKITLGQPLAIVEAMKMQNMLRAERDATVKEVKVGEGASVVVDQVLIQFE